jgi:preprotein translocase SecE subunit
MAKTRAQRKAERRAREAQQQRQGERTGTEDSTAQHDTQVPVSGDVAEVEAVEAGMAAGAPEDALEVPEAPAPARRSRSERRAAEKQRKEAEKRTREDQKRKERERLARKQKQAAAEERQRGRVLGFLASCWAELKRVQWPDRETLIQASAVTIVFVAIAAAYLGALDAAFNFLIKRIL